MRVPARLVGWLHRQLRQRVAERRPSDVVIGGVEDPYLVRWWVIPRNPVFNIYLHLFLRSDDDRALHDHPWVNCSLLLEGRYAEHLVDLAVTPDVPEGTTMVAIRTAGELVFRGPRAAHRIELIDGPVWTLFVTGPRVREWGFHCPKGWKHWQDFTAFRSTGDSGRVGPGCDP